MDARDVQRLYQESCEEEEVRGFCPSPPELLLRRADVMWLRGMGFSDGFIRSVMHYDCPGIATVQKLCRNGWTPYGVEDRYRDYIHD